jgi:hypothetical protein
LIEHKLCWAVGNDATSEGDHIVEALRGAGEIVRGRDDRAATRRLGVKDVHDLLLRRGINAGDGLVEEIDLWICGDRTRQEDPATLTTREFADLSLCKISHINTREGICHCGMIGGAGSAQRSKRWGTTHHHDLANRDGEAPINLLGLWHIRHTLRVHAHSCSKHLHAATPRLHQPSDALQQR